MRQVQVLCKRGAWRPGSIGIATMFFEQDGAPYNVVRFV